MARKTWNEKLNNGKEPHIEILSFDLGKRFNASTMLIPTPLDVESVMKTVDEGKLITTDLIRKKLATKFGADVTCPMTTGIFVNIAANAADERKIQGFGLDTPYWRTLKTGGVLNAKYPGGIEQQRALLFAEGFNVVATGKSYVIADYENYLV